MFLNRLLRGAALRAFSALLGAGLLLANPPAALASDAPAGEVLADSGFRPNPNGFGFENWGGDAFPQANLTPNETVKLFGDKVCARFEGDQCVPTPAAKLWIQEMNQAIKIGHCDGMAAMSAAFHLKTEAVKDYGASVPFALKANDQELLRTISAYWTTQTLEPVLSSRAKSSGWALQEIVDSLVATLSSGTDYPTIGIFYRDGGHAVTPYMVVQLDAGLYRVYVYDNNYPGVENFIDIDTPGNRWMYAGATLNPSEPATPWEGGAGAMQITLLSSRYEPLACPFCGKHQAPTRPSPPRPGPRAPRAPSINSEGYSVYTPNRCSQIRATRKSDKRQLRMGKSRFESQIDGAAMLPMVGSRGCYVSLPYGVEYDLVLVDDGYPSFYPKTDLVVFSPGSVYSISDISVTVNVNQSFSFGQKGFSYKAGGRQSPKLRVAGDAAGTNGYYEVSGFTLSENTSFNAERNDSGQMVFGSDDPSVESFDISAEAVGATETRTFEFDDVEVGENGEAMLDVEGDGDIDLDIDSDSDGASDDTDADDDNDGSADEVDADDDNDGEPDSEDSDDATEDLDDADSDVDDADADAEDAAEDDSAEDDSAEDDGAEDDSAEDDSAEDDSAEDDSAEDDSAEDDGAEDDSAEDDSAEDDSAEDDSAEDDSAEDDSAEDDSAEDDSAEDDSAEDDSAEDDSAEDDSAEDDSAEDDSAEDDSAEDDSAEDDSAEEDSAEDDSAEDDSAEDDSAEEESAEEESAEDYGAEEESVEEESAEDYGAEEERT